MDVAQPAAPAARHHNVVAGLAQIGQKLAVRLDDRARRDQDRDVLAALAVLLVAGAVAAALGLVVTTVAEFEQGAGARIGTQVDAAATTAVAAVRTTARH